VTSAVALQGPDLAATMRDTFAQTVDAMLAFASSC
jgi:hypothetical protein